MTPWPPLSASLGYRTACPLLSVLAVSDAEPIRVRKFVQARLSLGAAAMDHVVFRHGLKGNYFGDDLNWLQTSMAVGAKMAYDEPKWIESDDITTLPTYPSPLAPPFVGCVYLCLWHLVFILWQKIQKTCLAQHISVGPRLLSYWSKSDASTDDATYRLMVLAWPTPKWPLRNGTMPVEIWLDVFDWVCNGMDLSFSESTRLRDGLCEASDEWAHVVEANSSFWRRLSIDCETKVGNIEHHLQFCGPTLFDVTVRFDPVNYFSEDASIDSADIPERVAVATRCLITAASALPQWRRVCLWSLTDTFMEPIIGVLGSLYAPNIESLMVFGISPAAEDRCDHLFVWPPTLFGAGIPRLLNLHPLSAVLPWGAPLYFRNLQELEYASLPLIIRPSPQNLVLSLLASTSLRELTVRGCIVRPMDPAQHIPQYIVSGLQVLTIVATHDCQPMFDMLAMGAFPSLTELHLQAFEQPHWTSLYRTTVLSHIHTLSIARGQSAGNMSAVFGSLSALRSLDISEAGYEYFYSLMNAGGGSCPMLRHLSVGDVPIDTIFDFVRARPEGARLETVVLLPALVHVFSDVEKEAIKGIKCMVDTFRML
ncbi:hypothetical protein B0H17DRAFT_1124001 [Mycena rosella]|uniref:Uncharacterized protein n=1 Tax=Mycena rosella TaxID=1033263 RepID=A0AAD7H2W5_MYCRO|nr:hypothetical protein B0H17DRAFT_1124001 [Mycena rosella]